MKGLLLLALVTCSLAAFCINGRYDYSYDYSYAWDPTVDFHDFTVRSYSTVMVLDPVTEKPFSRNVDQVEIGDMVLTHSGHFTAVTNVTLTTIANPQLYFRRGLVNEFEETYTQVGLDIKPVYDNVVFTDSTLFVMNKTVGYYAPNAYTTAYQFGIMNLTSDITYDIFSYDGAIYYYREGIEIINMAEILNFISVENITSFTFGSITYYNIVADILSCDAVEITTDSGNIAVNGLLF